MKKIIQFGNIFITFNTFVGNHKHITIPMIFMFMNKLKTILEMIGFRNWELRSWNINNSLIIIVYSFLKFLFCLYHLIFFICWHICLNSFLIICSEWIFLFLFWYLFFYISKILFSLLYFSWFFYSPSINIYLFSIDI